MRQAVTSSLDCTIKFWDIGNGDNKNVINTYSKVYDMHINRSETSLVTGHNDYSIRVWNVKTRESMFKKRSLIGNNPGFYELDHFESVDVDTPFDFFIAEQITKNYKL